MKPLRSFFIALLIITFGIPSILGSGLHFFIAHPHSEYHETTCFPCTHTNQSDQVVCLSKVHELHDETTCFLCKFLSIPVNISSTENVLIGEYFHCQLAAIETVILTEDVSSLYSGRGPPLFFDLFILGA